MWLFDHISSNIKDQLYKYYHDIHHKNISNVKISASETNFLNFELLKGNIEHFLCKINSMV